MLDELRRSNRGPLSAEGLAGAAPRDPRLSKREVGRRKPVVLFLLALDGELVGRDLVEELRNSSTISSSFTSSPSNSIADSSITRSAAKIGASARTASAIASDGRESTSISVPFSGS